MKISVIIPSFNREKLIAKAIKSVQDQSVKVDEIIVVDDGSTDNTKELLKDFNIRYIYQKNKGVSAARNVGITHAKNQWLAFLDSDDIWHKEKIKHHIDLHQNNKKLLASFTDELWIRNNKEIKLKQYQQKTNPSFSNSLRLCKIGTSTFFCHKKVFGDIGLFDESLKACEDYDLWLRVLLDYEIKYINKKLTTKYAGHENQLSFNTKLIDTYRIEALEKHINTPHKKEVIEEIIYKIDILLKGAIKHQNDDLIIFYKDKLKNIMNH
ncbi:MAG: glycosyltransferase family 2 protein [Halarcobacter sp.]